MKTTATLPALILLGFIHTVHAETWKLPQSISASNTEVRFEVDSTWHLVKGIAKEVKGKVWLARSNNPLSVRAEVILPVNAFDTDSKARDSKMRKVMHATEFPDVVFKLDRDIPELCAPRQVKPDLPCQTALKGSLAISGVTTAIDLPITITNKRTEYQISGALPIHWEEFNVEDPSILIAKLAPVVNVSFKINIPLEQ